MVKLILQVNEVHIFIVFWLFTPEFESLSATAPQYYNQTKPCKPLKKSTLISERMLLNLTIMHML